MAAKTRVPKPSDAEVHNNAEHSAFLDVDLGRPKPPVSGTAHDRTTRGFPGQFYYAGARAVVATLWNVNDLSTAQLMKSFYSRIRAGLAPEDALREAKIEMERGNHKLWKNPWFWSPFIISQ